MSQPSAKEIAERIVKLCGDLRKYQQLFEFDKQFETLARAYLELGKDYEKLYSDYTNLLNSGQAKEITKLKACEARLKEENAQLFKYCGEVRYWQNRAEDLSEELERLKNGP